jgi:hypothetical protein
MLDWQTIGNGSVFDNGNAPDLSADVLSRDRARVRSDYAKPTEYSLESLVSYVERFGCDDLVLVPIPPAHQCLRHIYGAYPDGELSILDRMRHDGVPLAPCCGRPECRAGVWGS